MAPARSATGATSECRLTGSRSSELAVSNVRRVALTGGIGSGKSAVSALLAERGAVVIDADLLAREVVAPGTAGLAEIVIAFGPDLIDADGGLNRSAMSERVFKDPVARRQLERIVHPRVRARAEQIEALAREDAVVVHDIPLLAETGQVDRFDDVVVVDCPPEVQIARLVSERGMTAQEARDRLAAQATREQRLAVADHVVSNEGSLDELREAVEQLWQTLSDTAAGHR